MDVDVNHFVTITMQFELPAGTTQAEFESTLRIGYFNVQDQVWIYSDDPASGIFNIPINWLNNTITFDANHFSRFAAILPVDQEVPPDCGHHGHCGHHHDKDEHHHGHEGDRDHGNEQGGRHGNEEGHRNNI